jgi:Tol biopolymer transport system component
MTGRRGMGPRDGGRRSNGPRGVGPRASSTTDARAARTGPQRRRVLDQVRAREGWIAPGLSAVGLVLVAIVTAGLFLGRLPFGPLPGVGPTQRPTPNPSTVVPAKKTNVLGTLLFVRNGDIWAASGTGLAQLTDTGADSSPSWTADGQWIYLIETREKKGVSFPYQGTPSDYTLHYPLIVRMHPDGSGRDDVANSLYTAGVGGRYTYHVWYLEPAPDPKGKRIAIVSDGPDPIGRDPVIQLMPATGGKLTNLRLPYTVQLGLADPTWRPDGGAIAYTRYDRVGVDPAHRVVIYDVTTKKTKVLTGPGYSQPSWSPDGRYIAAVRWTATRRDVVVVDAKTGTEVLAVTDDGQSWAPAWSPAGDVIAFLTASGQAIDLETARLVRSGSVSAVAERLPITEDSILDGTSRPTWYIPPDQLPTPSPIPSPTASSSPSGAASPSP